MQVDRRSGLFECNGNRVVSDEVFQLGEIAGESVMTWAPPSSAVVTAKGDEPKTDAYLATKRYIQAWNAMVSTDTFWSYHFVVKVDPFTVFFPGRLRDHIKSFSVDPGDKVYFANCGKWGGKPLLYGSLEVFSTEAMRLYQTKVDECTALSWEIWEEAHFMQQCMDLLGASELTDERQVADPQCVDSPCVDWTRVAFHEEKTADAWDECYKEAIGEIRIKTELVPRKRKLSR